MTVAEKLAALFPAANAIPPDADIGQALNQTEYLINGQIKRWTGPTQEVLSPVCTAGAGGLTQRRLGSFPLMDGAAALQALDAAAGAYACGRGAWPTMPVEQRIRHMEEFVLRMKAKRAEVVKLLMWEIGKSGEDSAKEFDRTVEYIADTIEALKSLDRVSSRFDIQQGIVGQIRRAPLGVVLCMGPFNYPLNETFTTLIPALIMGNTVVFKPARHGVLLHRPLLEAFRDSFPPGVVNTVYGEGRTIITPLMATGKVDVLAFIGSSKVADTLKKQHPRPHRLRCVLGLDAKNAAIVLPDADLELAVKECALGSLSYNGQRCTAIKIIFVHRTLADAFVKRLGEEIAAMPLGMPWLPGVKLTPLPEPGKSAYLTAIVKDATSKGARVANPEGGSACGTFFYPAVLLPVNASLRVWTEEQFGPVVPVAVFDELEEPVRYVIDSSFGQQVSVFGANPDTMGRLLDPLVNQVCRVNVNSQCQRGPDAFPFTGRKDSAEGTLSVSDALRVFSIRTLVAAKMTDVNRALVTDIVRGRKSNFLSTDFVL
jgi:glyceraldehyde-3-phosphate dehydrogenase (NADP+)